MTKLKAPLLSFLARGKLGDITFLRRRHRDIAEKTPVVPDQQTVLQLAHRATFQACIDLWHLISASERAEWEALGTINHMTGYAWYLSQCLKPNPLIFLPLAGGTMSGEIAMGTNSIIGLPAPTGSGHATRKSYVDGVVALARYTQGARVYHNAAQAIPNITLTAMAFNSESFDTDVIHNNVTNNSRLTCKTAGKYLISARVRWAPHAAGERSCRFTLNGTTTIELSKEALDVNNTAFDLLFTTYDLAVNDYLEVNVYQNSGDALDAQAAGVYAPVFIMQRIG